MVAIFFAVTAVSGAPWVPIRKFDIDQVIADSKLKSGDKFIELGCGDGRMVKAAAKNGARAIGYELNLVLWLIGWLRCLGTKNAKIRFGDLWGVDLSAADVVMVFLVPRTMPKLGLMAQSQMKRGSRLVSYIFEIPGKKPDYHSKSWFIYRF